MSEKGLNYKKYIILGINKAMTTFLISFLISLIISLVINLNFYEQLVAITIGSLGEAETAGIPTILRTTVTLLNLSAFNSSGKFQLGIIILALIPFLSFLVSGVLFKNKEVNHQKQTDLISSIIIDGLAAILYSTFLLISAFITAGDLFGLKINFVSIWNFFFTIAFALFIQFILGINRHKRFTIFTQGILRTRNLLRLILGFSALTGLLFILYYITPYLESFKKIFIFIVLVLPNLAIYLAFLLMGISVDLNDSLNALLNYLNIDVSFFAIPILIRIILVVVFIFLVFILILNIEKKRYWPNLIIFALGFSFSTFFLALCSRIHLGYVRGALNINFEISALKAFMIPFIVILLNGILIMLIRMLQKELKDNDKNEELEKSRNIEPAQLQEAFPSEYYEEDYEDDYEDNYEEDYEDLDDLPEELAKEPEIDEDDFEPWEDTIPYDIRHKS